VVTASTEGGDDDQMSQLDGKFRIEERVRWGDVDAAGIIF
jgi:hypothetical protein